MLRNHQTIIITYYTDWIFQPNAAYGNLGRRKLARKGSASNIELASTEYGLVAILSGGQRAEICYAYKAGNHIKYGNKRYKNIIKCCYEYRWVEKWVLCEFKSVSKTHLFKTPDKESVRCLWMAIFSLNLHYYYY